MRRKFAEMSSQMEEHQNDVKDLTQEVKRLKAENFRLTTDMDDVKKDHGEIVGKFRDISQKNDGLVLENLTLKDLLYERDKARARQGEAEVVQAAEEHDVQ